jgi:hypothetical protein
MNATSILGPQLHFLTDITKFEVFCKLLWKQAVLCLHHLSILRVYKG